MKIKNTNNVLLPREKAMQMGIKNLDNYELFAIIMRTGTKNDDVVELAKKLVSSIPSLSFLYNMTIQELTNFKGIGKAKALAILAALELGKRSFFVNKGKVTLKDPIDIYEYAKPLLCNLKQETLLAIFMNNKGVVEAEKILTIGTSNTTLIDPRMIIGYALKLSCFRIAIAHNHPSGDSTPSYADDLSTDELYLACENMKITFIDHIIIGENEFYSYGSKDKIYIE